MRDYRKVVQKDEKKKSSTRDYRTSLTTVEKKAGEKKKEAAKPAPVQLPSTMHPDNAIRSFNQQNQVTAPVQKSVQPSYLKPQADRDMVSQLQQYKTNNNIGPEPELPGRDLPVVGPVLGFLDKVQKFTEPAAKIAEEYYTPGAGLAAIGAFRSAGTAALGRVAPKIAQGASLEAKIAREFLLEAPAGAVLNSGQALSRHPEDMEGVGRAAAGGALIGGGLGMISPIVGQGLRAAAPKVAQAFDKALQTIPYFKERAAKIGERATKAEFGKTTLADIDKQIQAVGRGNAPDKEAQFQSLFNDRKATIDFITQNEPKFEAPKPRISGSRDMSTLTPIEEPTPIGVADDFAPAAAATPGPATPAVALGSIESQVADYVRQNPNAGIGELQGKFKLGYTTLQKIKDAVNTGTPMPTSNTRAAAIASQQSATQQSAATGERGLFRNMRDNDNGQFSDQFNQARAASDNTYEVATDKAALEAANRNIEDPRAAMKYLADDKPSKEATTTAIRLMQKLDQAGEHDTALAVYNKLKADLTNLGQATQAASLIGKLTPEGQLMQLIGAARKVGKEITVDQKVKFQSLAREVQEKAGAGARNNEFNTVLDKIQKGETVSPEELKTLNDFMARAKKVLPDNRKAPKVKDELPAEFKDVKKRDKIVSFLDKAEKDALARIAARKNNLNSLPLNEWADHAIVVASQIGKGTIKAATHVEDLVRLFGEDIRNDASTVFKQAQSIVRGVTRTAGADKVREAEQIIRRLSGAEEAEKALVEEAALHVRKMVGDAKVGKIDEADVTKLQAYADEVSSFPEPKKKDLTPEAKYARTVKSLLKKINKVETEKVPADQANREVQSLLRQVSNIKEQDLIPPIPDKIETDSLRRLSEAALDTKQLTPQQKVVRKFIQTTPELSPQDIVKLRKLSQDVTELSGNDRFNADLKMQDMMNSFEKSSLYDKALTLRYIGMLWNTTTQLVNVSSGVTRAVSGVVEDLPATFIDNMIVKHFKGKQSATIYNNDPFALVADIFKNLGKGMRAGWHGTNPGGITNIDEVRGLVFKNFDDDSLLAKSAKAIPQLLERSLGAVAKGADYAVYKAVADRELVQQGFLSAKRAGIKNKLDIEAHIRKFVEDPPEEALLQADQIGKNTTFQRSDSAGGVVARTVNNLPMVARVPANIVAPFIKTPINILSAAANYSPFGIIKGLFQLSGKFKASDREALRNIGAGIIGTGLFTPTGFYLNKIGVLTGANDTGDKEVNAVRAQMGQDKYKLNTSALGRFLMSFLQDYDLKKAEKAAAFRKGDKQLDYNKLQPFALLPSIGVSINENKGKSLAEAAGKVGTDALGSFTSMSMLRGIQSLVAPDYNAPVGEGNAKLGSRLAEQALTGFSPSVLAQAARVSDPVQRKTAYNQGVWKDVTDYYKSRMPGLSKTLPAQVTTLGDTKVYARGVIAQFLNPYKLEDIPYNDAAKVITDLIDKTGDTTLAPAAAFKQVTGTDKTTKEKKTVSIIGKDYEELQSKLGKEITKNILSLSPLLTDAKRADKIHEIYDKAKKKYSDEIKRKNGIRVTK